MAAMLIYQTVVNIGMCLFVMPTIGVTLPFFSYGGSSIVTLYAAMGVCRVSRSARPPSAARGAPGLKSASPARPERCPAVFFCIFPAGRAETTGAQILHAGGKNALQRRHLKRAGTLFLAGALALSVNAAALFGGEEEPTEESAVTVQPMEIRTYKASPIGPNSWQAGRMDLRRGGGAEKGNRGD